MVDFYTHLFHTVTQFIVQLVAILTYTVQCTITTCTLSTFYTTNLLRSTHSFIVLYFFAKCLHLKQIQ